MIGYYLTSIRGPYRACWQRVPRRHPRTTGEDQGRGGHSEQYANPLLPSWGGFF